MTDNIAETLVRPANIVLAPRRELFAWAMYDFANSGYTTVVLTAVFNAYFVGVVAASVGGAASGAGTLYWTVAIAITNALILFSAPVLGAIADHRADKKRFLAVTTAGCVISTALLAIVGPGDVWLGMVLVILSAFMFGTGENLIAAFLPEIAPQGDMGRISGYGWSLGYLGGLLVLGFCLVYVSWAESQGQAAPEYVPVTMVMTAIIFGLAAMPTFLWLPERATVSPLSAGQGYVSIGFTRVMATLRHVRHFRDLFRFLLSLTVYYCGIYTVVVLAAVYAREVMDFSTGDTLILILVINVTAAAGAFVFGHVQDKLGSLRTLALTLALWIAALVLAYFTESRGAFWIVGNLVGLALGSSQSAGRALVGQFAPPRRSAEFFGLWGLASKLAAVVGPLSYGTITFLSGGNQRAAVLSTVTFFIVGLLLLSLVDEARGRRAALTAA
ncbi:MAG: MFS transporter [Acidiferrobacterales bacterium]